MNPIETFLLKTELFQNLKKSQISKVSTLFKKKKVNKGDFLYQSGGASKSPVLYVYLSDLEYHPFNLIKIKHKKLEKKEELLELGEKTTQTNLKKIKHSLAIV